MHDERAAKSPYLPQTTQHAGQRLIHRPVAIACVLSDCKMQCHVKASNGTSVALSGMHSLDSSIVMSIESNTPDEPETIVVIGNGMVGLRFCERLVEYDLNRRYRIVTFCEEPRAAYDRVGLTSFFAHRDAEKLMLARREWYERVGIKLHLGDRACTIDRDCKTVVSSRGVEIAYDRIVMATGSYPLVPPIPGIRKKGVFVYRTIEDLQHIIQYAEHSKACAVIGGGLLGLEAAKAAFDLDLETHVIEFASRLMPRQVDDAGSETLVRKIEELGVHVHLSSGVQEVYGDRKVERIKFTTGESIDCEMIIVSAGIRPRDELAQECGLALGEHGGIQVNDRLQTSDSDIFAIGECTFHNGMIYGLMAPGWEMAEIVAANLCGDDRRFGGTDVSRKLKLMGVDVASFGDYETSDETVCSTVFSDPVAGTYRRLVFSKDGNHLVGGILIGDAADYGTLLSYVRSQEALPCSAGDLTAGSAGGATAVGTDMLPDSGQVCSSSNFSGTVPQHGEVSRGNRISARR